MKWWGGVWAEVTDTNNSKWQQLLQLITIWKDRGIPLPCYSSLPHLLLVLPSSSSCCLLLPSSTSGLSATAEVVVACNDLLYLCFPAPTPTHLPSTFPLLPQPNMLRLELACRFLPTSSLVLLLVLWRVGIGEAQLAVCDKKTMLPVTKRPWVCRLSFTSAFSCRTSSWWKNETRHWWSPDSKFGSKTNVATSHWAAPSLQAGLCHRLLSFSCQLLVQPTALLILTNQLSYSQPWACRQN